MIKTIAKRAWISFRTSAETICRFVKHHKKDLAALAGQVAVAGFCCVMMARSRHPMTSLRALEFAMASALMLATTYFIAQTASRIVDRHYDKYDR